jgi:hypothetical protein
MRPAIVFSNVVFPDPEPPRIRQTMMLDVRYQLAESNYNASLLNGYGLEDLPCPGFNGQVDIAEYAAFFRSRSVLTSGVFLSS